MNATLASRAAAPGAMSLPANATRAVKAVSQSDFLGAGLLNIYRWSLCCWKASAVFLFMSLLLCYHQAGTKKQGPSDAEVHKL